MIQTRTKALIAAIGGALALGVTGGAVAGKGKDENGRHGGHMGMMFEMIDADGDGKVTREEVDAFHEGQLEKFDTDGNGSLNADEYVAMMEDFRRQMMLKSFERKDENGDGMLDKAEMGDRMDGMFERMDRNDDGVIEKDEMRKRGGHHGGYGDYHKKGDKGEKGDRT